MSAPAITLDLDDTLDVAEDVMTLGNVRHIPVTSRGKLVGIVSQRDLLRASVSSLLGSPEEGRRLLKMIPVRQFAHEDPFVIEPAAPLSRAAALMCEHKVGCLPVVLGGKLLGVVTTTDLLRAQVSGNVTFRRQPDPHPEDDLLP